MSALSLCRRVKPVLLITMLFVCSAASAKSRGVTLDVKDADVHVVLKSIQKQCAIRNLVIDPSVGKRHVPLSQRAVQRGARHRPQSQWPGSEDVLELRRGGSAA